MATGQERKLHAHDPVQHVQEGIRVKEDVPHPQKDVHDHDRGLCGPQDAHVLPQTVRVAVQAGSPVVFSADPPDETSQQGALQHDGQPADEMRPDQERQEQQRHGEGDAEADVDQVPPETEGRGDPRYLRQEQDGDQQGRHCLLDETGHDHVGGDFRRHAPGGQIVDLERLAARGQGGDIREEVPDAAVVECLDERQPDLELRHHEHETDRVHHVGCDEEQQRHHEVDHPHAAQRIEDLAAVHEQGKDDIHPEPNDHRKEDEAEDAADAGAVVKIETLLHVRASTMAAAIVSAPFCRSTRASRASTSA